VAKRTPTPAFLHDLSPPAAEISTGYRLIRDPDTRRLHLRITKAGAKSWVHIGARSYTIGSFGDWSYPQARERAKELNRLIDEGKDPYAASAARRTAPTIADLVEAWRQDIDANDPPRLRPSTRREYEGMIGQWILPALGKRAVVDVTADDVKKLHLRITKEGKNRGTPRRADLVLSLVSALFTLAIKEKKWRADNPVQGVRRNGGETRFRMLTAAEIARLIASIQQCRHVAPRRAVLILMATGARRAEVLGMRWSQIDLAAGTWVKPPRSTKQKRLHVVPLSTWAREVLAAIDREQQAQAERAVKPMSQWVFPAEGLRDKNGNPRDEPVKEIRTTWGNICRRANLRDLHLHDLRHVFGSYLASRGTSLYMIGQLLGHSQSKTTQIYSHIALDPQREQVEDFGNFIKAIETGQTAEVVKLTEGPQPAISSS
jgi:integrase